MWASGQAITRCKFVILKIIETYTINFLVLDVQFLLVGRRPGALRRCEV